MSGLQSYPPSFNVYGGDAADSPPTYGINTQVMVGAIVLLFVVIFIVLAIHVYVRWFLRRSSGYSFAIRRGTALPAQQQNMGLDKAVIAQLPTFVYTLPAPVDASVATPAAAECAVCLSEFQEDEKLRMLPVCKHMFHTECIDMWFFSHSTCPLCRTSVVPVTAGGASTEGTWTDQEQEATDTTEESSTSSLPLSPSLPTPAARALPDITIDIPPVEDNLSISASGCISAKSITDEEAGTSQPLKSPSIRASIKRMLSRQSSRHRSPRQEVSEEISPTK